MIISQNGGLKEVVRNIGHLDFWTSHRYYYMCGCEASGLETESEQY